jgi:BlaI family transcriptional regulator, penicillinase repressor
MAQTGKFDRPRFPRRRYTLATVLLFFRVRFLPCYLVITQSAANFFAESLDKLTDSCKNFCMKKTPNRLSRREQQIMEAVYAKGEVTVAEVFAVIPDAPSYNTIRNLMSILENKGHLTHREEGIRYIYTATQPRTVAAKSALARVVETFFGGSVEQTVTALLSSDEFRLSDAETERIAALLDAARKAEETDYAPHSTDDF